MTEPYETDIPDARIRPPRSTLVRHAPLFCALALTAMLIVPLGYHYLWSARGIRMLIEFKHGHGLRPGDPLRSRGINIGQVADAHLSTEDGIVVEVKLSRQARSVARAGSRFWVVRPEVGIQGVYGLETLIGPRYLEVEPGAGEERHAFIGEEEPPLGPFDPRGLKVVLEAERRGSLTRGAPVMVRQVNVGKVTRITLSTDGSKVEIGAYIKPEYRNLVTASTRFRDASGVRVGFNPDRGPYVDIDSLQTILLGGVELVPGEAGGPSVAEGQAFRLENGSAMAVAKEQLKAQAKEAVVEIHNKTASFMEKLLR